MAREHWRDLSPAQRGVFVAASVVNFVGLIAYLCFGRARTKGPTS